MVPGNTVRPQKWTNVIDLFDDGTYSAIWGEYDGTAQRCLGVRWNGDTDEIGYPNQGANPLWYVEPEFVARPILLWLLNAMNSNPNINNRQLYMQNILLALQECP
jgi:hypothetical protein